MLVPLKIPHSSSYCSLLLSTALQSRSISLAMAGRSTPTTRWLSLCVAALHLTLSLCTTTPPKPPSRTYIIHMAKSEMPQIFTHRLQWYASTIKSVTSSPKLEAVAEEEEDPAERIIYSYENAFHGFAAKLTEDEAEKLESIPGVATVLPETIYRLHTTRSPEFLGITGESNSMWSAALSDHDVIVGILDTGIWPESPSFSDGGMTAVPPRWRGACETGRGFTAKNCNQKLVGARIFYRGYEASSGAIDERSEFKSPRDQDGHGTHTAATVAGAPVRGANLLGYARGTARGMAPRARVAVYKVCWTGGCFSSDILAAVDRAVADGVDVLSISLGGGISTYYRDSLSVAAFGAMEMGVFVACSAGNGGPEPISLTNVSPWIATVGASTMDRDFPAPVRLGNGMNLTGVSLYKGRRNLSPRRQYPLVYMGGNTSIPDPRSLCLEGTLDPHVVAGKIVVCDRGISPRVQKGQVVKDAGGLGMILANTDANGEELVADSHLLPAVAVGEAAGKAIKQYSNVGSHPTATMTFEGTKVGIRPSPVVAAFSSRGPNILTLEILKPDVVAPGVNILAAWSGDASPSSLLADHRRVRFNILSGTSMSCPHVGGVAALLKASHPDWSPSAIKSALMTTAYTHDNTFRPLKDAATGAPSTPYDHGAGHIRPAKAVDPGLIYDISPDDYFEFLCTQKLTPLQLKVFSKSSNRTCKHRLASPGDLNYPAISAVFREQPAPALTLHRTVTNVGPPVSTYHVRVTPFRGVDVAVEPKTLHFTHQNQKLSYKVTFRTKSPQPMPGFGALIWSDGIHLVRSPVAVTWLAPL
ncbi:subtilisin-like protease SBT1.3 [Phoenix dactylifera]|uniref:Subtilisin-like protease SBT1.3 n=1 Tax=Phoenix dactylifera TaxID=42345 RepID=A0A8B7BL58_PHODC|nr:subtilisin-like protease SBT1.3 [Phoenix dactylifera]